MKLLEIFKDVVGNEYSGKIDNDIEISDINLDSRNVKAGSLFIAVKGLTVDGNDFIDQAVASGVQAVITSDKAIFDIRRAERGYCLIYNPDLTNIIGQIFANFYKNDKPESIAAVTGTNGKSSVANFYQQLCYHLDIKAASIGTLGVIYGDGEKLEDINMTTPNQEILYKIFSNLQEKQISHVVLEASSHGIEQKRVDNIGVNVAAFTNLTVDHLDYHQNMENYFASKARLFSDILESDGTAIINSDSDYANRLLNICKDRGEKIKVIEFGYNTDGNDRNFQILEIVANDYLQIVTCKFAKEVYEFTVDLVGEFQISNLLCSIAMLVASGVNLSAILNIVSKVKTATGRAERVTLSDRQEAGFFIDYAHTPDGLENILQNLRTITQNRLIVVFGCGGQRDQSKRPMMGAIANQYADFIIVTDDNPRKEDPIFIRSQITEAIIDKGKLVEIADRKEAILYAKKIAAPGDVVLVAGKGHENYQITAQGKKYFSDRDILLGITSG